jgi:hypothetical protein
MTPNARGKTSRPTATSALGFKLHTGWAIAVGVLSRGHDFEILLRRRIELFPHDDDAYRFIYHRASELPAAGADALIRKARTEARKASTVVVRELIQSMKLLGHAVKYAGMPASDRMVPMDLFSVLRSHPFVHTAEGIFYRKALTGACTRCGLEVAPVHERDAVGLAATQRDLEEVELRKAIEGLRKSVGTPWGADHKAAAALALVACGLRGRASLANFEW